MPFRNLIGGGTQFFQEFTLNQSLSHEITLIDKVANLFWRRIRYDMPQGIGKIGVMDFISELRHCQNFLSKRGHFASLL